MNKGGRLRDIVWAQFVEPAVNKKVSCRGCDALVCAKVERHRVHIKKCPALVKPAPQPVLLPCPKVALKPEPVSAPSVQTVPPKKLQPSIMGHVVITSAAEKAKLDQAVANFILGCRLPFLVSEHPLFIAMVDQLHPGYKPPTRKSLSNLHLDNTHTKLQSKMKSELEGKTNYAARWLEYSLK